MLYNQVIKYFVLKVFFSLYEAQVAHTNKVFDTFPLNPITFKPDLTALRQKLATGGYKTLILNYPNNPTGISLDQADRTALYEVLKDFPDVTIVFDDAYFQLQNHPQHILNEHPDLWSRSIVLYSLSKQDLALPPLRCGFVLAPEATINQIFSAGLALTTSGTPNRTQLLAQDFFESDKAHAFNRELVAELATKRQILEKSLPRNVQATGDAGMASLLVFNFEELTFPESFEMTNNTGKKSTLTDKRFSSPPTTSAELSTFLKRIAGVACVPASAFGFNNNLLAVRLSLGLSPEILQEICSRISECMQQLTPQKAATQVAEAEAELGTEAAAKRATQAASTIVS